MPAAHKPRIAIATDCSGMETPVMALLNLGIEVDHLFSCDVNKHAKRTIMANFPPKIFYDDLTKRDNSKAPKAHLYVAGFPCQPFSTAGLQQGFNDKRGRGEIFWYVRDYIEKSQPRMFILENVSGLVKINGGQYYAAIMDALQELRTYNVYSQILDTRDNGLPHNRRRIYIVGIQKFWDDGTFEYPEPVPCPSIECFLERRKVRPSGTELPPRNQSTARANVKRAVAELFESGTDPLEVPYIVDCDSSPPRMKYIKEASPCITCSRGAGHWVTNRMRRLTKTEMMRLQGMNPETFIVAVSEFQLGRQIGNAMSVNVLERLLARALPASGLVPHGAVTDRWENGTPPTALTVDSKKRKASTAGSKQKRFRMSRKTACDELPC